MKQRVVVTGMGALTPIGNTVGEFWASALRGESGATPITRFDASAFDTRFACEVKGFDPLEFLDRSLRVRADRAGRFELAIGIFRQHALEMPLIEDEQVIQALVAG